jgi:hypothetical protein
MPIRNPESASVLIQPGGFFTFPIRVHPGLNYFGRAYFFAEARLTGPESGI